MSEGPSKPWWPTAEFLSKVHDISQAEKLVAHLCELMMVDPGLVKVARHEGYNRLGYLTSAEFAYALACYCWLRREETIPARAKYVNPGPTFPWNKTWPTSNA